CSDDGATLKLNDEDNEGPKAKIAKNTFAFQSNWKNTFPWLEVLDRKAMIVVCRICREAKEKNAWASGKSLKTWRSTYMNDHKMSKSHKNAEDAVKLAKQDALVKSQKICIEKSCQEVMDNMMKVLFVVQQNGPIYFCSKVHEMITHLCDKNDQKRLLPSHHYSNFSTYEMLAALNKATYMEVIGKIRQSNGFTLHIDESTDITEQKHLLMYATFFDCDSQIQTTTYLALLEVKKADARSLCKLIYKFMSTSEIPLTKILNFTSDGASVMLGAYNGVAALLRNKYNVSHLLDFHCVAHSEALAFKDVLNAQEAPFFWRLETIVRDLIAFLSLQSTRHDLKELCEILEHQYVSVDRIFEIRWLSRFNVVTKILAMLKPILVFLNAKETNEMSNQAKRIYQVKLIGATTVLCKKKLIIDLNN
uniref:DUF4371 domain-containing protein n=1 Tax=Romanomermis culicivorax TaxID=13658 RepID=A0A915HHP2_ROMCU